MHFLITGHTGFKGSWMVLLLRELGHEVSGLSLDPTENSFFNQAGIQNFLNHDFRVDIRDTANLSNVRKTIRPDSIIHMAAQSLVRESYRNPIDTFEINVSGTLNILNFASKIDTLKSVLVVTTDKVYASKKTRVPYSETDKLGGSSDPYSISKSISDELTQSWRRSLSNIPISIARAGNVIGGGDYGGERLVPSIIESITRNDVPVLRNPNAVRPWQHVLDCLSGYLAIINLMEKSGVSGEWNIGPGLGESRKVYEITEIVSKLLINDSKWIGDQNKNPHEEDWLLLNVEKAHKELFWRNNLNVEEGIRWTCEWHCRIQAGEDPLEVSLNQIKRFVELINKS